MIFWRGGDDESVRAADVAKKKFENAVLGDMIACLSVFNEWMKLRNKDRSQKSKLLRFYTKATDI